MKQLGTYLNQIRRYEPYIYTALCIGIAYTLVFWTVLNSILCITMAGFWLLFTNKKGKIPVENRIRILIFTSLYLIFIVGLLYTSNIEDGLKGLQQKSALLLFPVIFGISPILTPKMTRVIIGHFTIATLIACFAGFSYGVYNVISTGDIRLLTAEHIVIFPDIYPYAMGLFCVLSIAILFELSAGYTRKKQLLLLLPIIFLSLFTILISNRLIIGCWLIIISFIIYKRYIKSLFYRLLTTFALIAAIVVSIATIPTLQVQWKDLVNTKSIQLDQDASLGQSWGGKAIRMAIWNCSKDIIQKHWLTGVGSGDIQDTLQATYEKRKFYFASRYNRYNVHNQYLHMIIGHGVMGISLLILSIAYPFLAYRRMPSHELYYIFLFLFCAICFTEVILNVNKGIVWYSFFNSIFAFSPSLYFTNTSIK